MKKIHLNPWEEIIGDFKGIEKDDSSISVLLADFKVSFNSKSLEAKIIEDALKDDLIGQKIAIIRTDITNKPLIVKRVL